MKNIKKSLRRSRPSSSSATSGPAAAALSSAPSGGNDLLPFASAALEISDEQRGRGGDGRRSGDGRRRSGDDPRRRSDGHRRSGGEHRRSDADGHGRSSDEHRRGSRAADESRRRSDVEHSQKHRGSEHKHRGSEHRHSEHKQRSSDRRSASDARRRKEAEDARRKQRVEASLARDGVLEEAAPPPPPLSTLFVQHDRRRNKADAMRSAGGGVGGSPRGHRRVLSNSSDLAVASRASKNSKSTNPFDDSDNSEQDNEESSEALSELSDPDNRLQRPSHGHALGAEDNEPEKTEERWEEGSDGDWRRVEVGHASQTGLKVKDLLAEEVEDERWEEGSDGEWRRVGSPSGGNNDDGAAAVGVAIRAAAGDAAALGAAAAGDAEDNNYSGNRDDGGVVEAPSAEAARLFRNQPRHANADADAEFDLGGNPLSSHTERSRKRMVEEQRRIMEEIQRDTAQSKKKEKPADGNRKYDGGRYDDDEEEEGEEPPLKRKPRPIPIAIDDDDDEPDDLLDRPIEISAPRFMTTSAAPAIPTPVSTTSAAGPSLAQRAGLGSPRLSTSSGGSGGGGRKKKLVSERMPPRDYQRLPPPPMVVTDVEADAEAGAAAADSVPMEVIDTMTEEQASAPPTLPQDASQDTLGDHPQQDQDEPPAAASSSSSPTRIPANHRHAPPPQPPPGTHGLPPMQLPSGPTSSARDAILAAVSRRRQRLGDYSVHSGAAATEESAASEAPSSRASSRASSRVSPGASSGLPRPAMTKSSSIGSTGSGSRGGSSRQSNSRQSNRFRVSTTPLQRQKELREQREREREERARVQGTMAAVSMEAAAKARGRQDRILAAKAHMMARAKSDDVSLAPSLGGAGLGTSAASLKENLDDHAERRNADGNGGHDEHQGEVLRDFNAGLLRTWGNDGPAGPAAAGPATGPASDKVREFPVVEIGGEGFDPSSAPGMSGGGGGLGSSSAAAKVAAAKAEQRRAAAATGGSWSSNSRRAQLPPPTGAPAAGAREFNSDDILGNIGSIGGGGDGSGGSGSGGSGGGDDGCADGSHASSARRSRRSAPMETLNEEEEEEDQHEAADQRRGPAASAGGGTASTGSLGRVERRRSGAKLPRGGGAYRTAISDPFPTNDPYESPDATASEEENDEVEDQAEEVRAPPPAAPLRSPSDASAKSAGSSSSDLPLRSDPEYAKYFAMLRAGVPPAFVRRVVQIDGKDGDVLDMDPNEPYRPRDGDNGGSGGGANDGNGEEDGDRRRRVCVSDMVENAAPILEDEDEDDEDTFDPSVKSKASAVSAGGVGGIGGETSPRSVLDLPKAGAEGFGGSPPVSPVPGRTGDGVVVNAAVGDRGGGGEIVNGSSATRDKAAALSALVAGRAAAIAGPGSDAEKGTSAHDSPGHDRVSALSAHFAERAATVPESDKSAQEHSPGNDKVAALSAHFANRAEALETDGKKDDDAHDAVPGHDKVSALSSLFANRAAALEADAKKDEAAHEAAPGHDKVSALSSLFAKRAEAMKPPSTGAASTEGGSSVDGPALKDDPQFAKYFKMLSMGMPMGAVKQALVRDGKDPSIADMDPEKPLPSSAKVNEGKDKEERPVLKDDPEFAKYFKMLSMGLPMGAVKQALVRDGKDPSIADMDPEKPLPSPAKDEEAGGKDKEERPALKDDPEFAKYFKMLSMGLPMGAVKQALVRDGKDPSIMDKDPEKPLQANEPDELKKVGDAKKKKPALKDDPAFAKYFKMLSMGLPVEAVKQAMVRDGKDPSIMDMDPEKPLPGKDDAGPTEGKAGEKAKSPSSKIIHKRLFWTSIDESKLDKGSLWAQAQADSIRDLSGLEYDADEFADLFTSKAGKKGSAGQAASGPKKGSKKPKVQIIDGRREMNGSILLAKFKHDYVELAKDLDRLNVGGMEETEICALMQLLPTKDEALALKAYLQKPESQADRDAAISKLAECEKYMIAMLDVSDATKKFQCVLYEAQFEARAAELAKEIASLTEASNCVKNSDKLTRLLLFALRLGNTLNTGGAGQSASAITLDSLLKLNEAKAFDKRTSVLHYLVSIIEKNDKDVLSVTDDLLPAKEAERIVIDTLNKSLVELSDGLDMINELAMDLAHSQAGNESGSTLLSADVDDVLKQTSTGRFAIDADVQLKDLSRQLDEAKEAFSDLLKYFGEDSSMPADQFFTTLNRFLAMFDKAHEDNRKKQEAKARKEKQAEKNKSLGTAGITAAPSANALSDGSKVLAEILTGGFKLKHVEVQEHRTVAVDVTAKEKVGEGSNTEGDDKSKENVANEASTDEDNAAKQNGGKSSDTQGGEKCKDKVDNEATKANDATENEDESSLESQDENCVIS